MPRHLLVALVAIVLLVGGCGAAIAPAPTSAPSTPAAPTPSTLIPSAQTVPSGFQGGTITLGQLPPEARVTLELVGRGGPFPYRQDGTFFGNREGLLPARPTGTYHEYTVRTPGSPDRGARRLIVGSAGERYYTDDHYDSFRFVVDR